jgi:hypothetical protein
VQELHRQLVWSIAESDWVPMTQPGGSSGGTSSNYGAAFPAAGTAVGGYNASSGDMVPLAVNDAGELIVTTGGGGNPAAGLTGAAPATAQAT